MSFDRPGLAAAIAAHGRVARLLILDSAGSVPRGAGTWMLVWADPENRAGQWGTIGGGALEYRAVQAARQALSTGRDSVLRQALGPNLAQCCGGAVTLLTEIWDQQRLDRVDQIAARPLPGTAAQPPLSVQGLLARARNGTAGTLPLLQDGWVIEPLIQAAMPVWIYGAGHVGRALVQMLAPLPDFAVTWIDTAPARFPAQVPSGVRAIPTPYPDRAASLAPPDAHHLIVTFSHALDLALCDALLRHEFGFAGLIGSATKWARFRKRLAEGGHCAALIDRITCPIGDPRLGKHPQAIAVGVVSGLLLARSDRAVAQDGSTGPGVKGKAAAQ